MKNIFLVLSGVVIGILLTTIFAMYLEQSHYYQLLTPTPESFTVTY